LEELSEQYPGGMVKAPIQVGSGGAYIAVEKLGNGAIDIAVIEYPLSKYANRAWARAFPAGKKPPVEHVFAQTALGVVVNKRNALTRLTRQQLRDICSGKATAWNQVGGFGGTIRIFTSKGLSGSMTNDFVSYPQWPETVKRVLFDTNVIACVMADSDAVGFVALTPDLPKDVKLLGIAPDANSPAVPPTVENVVLEKYPFVWRQYKMLLTETSSPAALEFAKFACGNQAAETIRKWGLIPAAMRAGAETDKRLAEMRAGKGIRVSALGIGSGRAALQDLALKYVQLRAVIQASLVSSDSDVAAVGAFVRAGTGATSMPAEAVGSAKPSAGTASSPPATMPTTAPAVVAPMTPFVAAGGKELLFLADKPSARAMEIHGQKWNALGRDANGGSTPLTAGQPNGTGPAEYLLAGRAAAVIVNPANKIDALTIGQLQAIFGGEVADWGTLGGAGLATSGHGKSQIGGSEIRAIGLRSDDLATRIFEKECLERARWKRVGIKKDSAEVLAAVSMDPQAIGFVDLAGISATGQSIKILAIKLGMGDRAKLIQPTPENIKNAMYPLSQRLWLYVHPQASDTAKDFVKFIATCGASEASPYADTVKAVMDTYRKNGLVPLADAALLRMTKDAMAEDAARAKAEAGRRK
jgi:ABC-type phosphate transport system substrate-binding protein